MRFIGSIELVTETFHSSYARTHVTIVGNVVAVILVRVRKIK